MLSGEAAGVLAAMRSEDWIAVMVVSSIVLAGLLCIAFGVSVEDDGPRR